MVFLLLSISTLSIINIDVVLKNLGYQPNIPATSYDSRLAIYQVDQKIISQNWLLGVGIDNFQNTYLQLQKYFPPYPQWAVPHAHNLLLHFWIEGGLLAVIGLVLLYNSIIDTNLKQKVLPLNTQPKNTKKTAFQLSMPQITLLYFIIHGIVDVPIWTPATATFFWFTTIYYLATPPNIHKL